VPTKGLKKILFLISSVSAGNATGRVCLAYGASDIRSQLTVGRIKISQSSPLAHAVDTITAVNSYILKSIRISQSPRWQIILQNCAKLSKNYSSTKTCVKAVPWLRRLVAGLPPRTPGFDPGSVHVGFVVDKVALGQVFPRVLRFSPVNIIPLVLHY
jgi:hypothetical protein